MTRKVMAFAAALPAVIFLDQLTKVVVVRELSLGRVIPVVPGFFNLIHIRNTGIAFGMFNDGAALGKTLLLTTAGILALGFLVWILRDMDADDLLGGLAVGCVAGGAIGNLIDRLRLGEVVDFLDVYWRSHHWPAFNMADSAITVGVALLIIHELVALRREVKTPCTPSSSR
jgi:signal peptidase II